MNTETNFGQSSVVSSTPRTDALRAIKPQDMPMHEFVTKLIESHERIEKELAGWAEAQDKEIGEFQQEVNELLDEKTGANVDGSGCDSGDWRDLTLCEINQGLAALKDKHAIEVEDAEEVERLRKELDVARNIGDYLANAIIDGSGLEDARKAYNQNLANPSQGIPEINCLSKAKQLADDVAVLQTRAIQTRAAYEAKDVAQVQQIRDLTQRLGEAQRNAKYWVDQQGIEAEKRGEAEHDVDVARGGLAQAFVELERERDNLRVEVEKVKDERNKAGVVERRKYLQKLSDLRTRGQEIAYELIRYRESSPRMTAAELQTLCLEAGKALDNWAFANQAGKEAEAGFEGSHEEAQKAQEFNR